MTHSWSVPSSAGRSGSYVPEQKKPRQFCAILYCAQHGPVFLLVALMLVAAATLAADYQTEASGCYKPKPGNQILVFGKFARF